MDYGLLKLYFWNIVHSPFIVYAALMMVPSIQESTLENNLGMGVFFILFFWSLLDEFLKILVISLHFFYKTKNPHSSLTQSMEKTAFRKPGLCQIHHYLYTHGSPLAVKSCKNQKFRKKTYLIVHKNLVLPNFFPWNEIWKHIKCEF